MTPIKCIDRDDIMNFLSFAIKKKKFIALKSGKKIEGDALFSFVTEEAARKYLDNNYPKGLDDLDMRERFTEAVSAALVKTGIRTNNTEVYSHIFRKTTDDITMENEGIMKVDMITNSIFDNESPSEKLSRDLMDIYGKQPYACDVMLRQFDTMLVPNLFVNKGRTVKIEDIPNNIYRLKLVIAKEVLDYIKSEKNDISDNTKIGEVTFGSIRKQFTDVLNGFDKKLDELGKQQFASSNTLGTDAIEDIFNVAFNNPGARIADLAQSSKEEDVKLFEMYNKLFILRHMDSLISKVYDRIFGEMDSDGDSRIHYHSYDLKRLNNLAKTWNDEDKELSAIDRAGNIVRSITNTFQYYDFVTKQSLGTQLGWSRMNGMIGILKQLLETDIASYSRVGHPETTLGSLISDLATGGADSYKRLFDFLFSEHNQRDTNDQNASAVTMGLKTTYSYTAIEEIANRMFREQEGASKSAQGYNAMKTAFINSAYSIYREMFDTNKDTAGMMLWKSYDDHVKNYNTPNYYEMVTHYFGSVNRINFSYLITDFKNGEIKSEALNDRPFTLARKRISSRIYNMVDNISIQVLNKMREMMRNDGALEPGVNEPSFEVETDEKGVITYIHWHNMYIPSADKNIPRKNCIYDVKWKANTSLGRDIGRAGRTGFARSITVIDGAGNEISDNEGSIWMGAIIDNNTWHTTIDGLISIITQTDMENNISLRQQFYRTVSPRRMIDALFSIPALSYVNRTMVTGRIKTKEELEKFTKKNFFDGKFDNVLTSINGVSINPISMGLDEWEMQFIDAICLYENSNLRDTVKYGGKQFSVSQMQRLLSDTGRQLRNIHNTPDAAARTSITQETVGDFIREDIGLNEQEEAFLFGRTMSEKEKAERIPGISEVERLAAMGEDKERSRFNVQECLFSDFAIGFLNGYMGGDDAPDMTRTTATVNSDKSIVHKIGNNTKVFNMLRMISNLDVDKDSDREKIDMLRKKLNVDFGNMPHAYYGNFLVARILSRSLARTYRNIIGNVRNDISKLNGFVKNVLKGSAGIDSILNDAFFSRKDKAVLLAMRKASYAGDIVSIKDNYSGFANFMDEVRKQMGTGYGNVTDYEAMMILVKAYNRVNNADMKLIDQTHFASDNDGRIHFKRLLIDQVFRYSDEYGGTSKAYLTEPIGSAIAKFGFNTDYFPGIESYVTTLRDMFMEKNKQFLFYTLVNDVNIILDDGRGKYLSSGTRKYAEDKRNKDWIKDGRMVLAKLSWIDGNNNLVSVDITDATDLRNIGYTQEELSNYNLFSKHITAGSSELVVNPALLDFNYMDFFLGENYKLNTVGGTFNHPAKKGGSTGLEEEGMHVVAADKRNVSYTASLSQFLTNTLTGIGETINVACVEDIQDNVSSMSGNANSIKPHDGICHVSPVTAYWMLNSTGDSKVGMDMKPFLHSYDLRTASGIIIKSSFNSLTNEAVRKGRRFGNMMYKTMAAEWRDRNGVPVRGNIFNDYNLNRYKANRKDKEDLSRYLILKYKPLVETKDGVFAITSITAVPDGKGGYVYRRRMAKVNEVGDYAMADMFDEGVDFKVNSNYDLWVLFGAENSREYDKELGRIVPSENSIRMVADMGNNVGLDNNMQPFPTGVMPRSQKDCHQFMKHGNADLIVSNGAIKQGYANVNRVYDVIDNKDGLPNTFKVRTDYFGIQLDPTHQAANSTVSELTQVLNSLSSMGFSSDDAAAIYEALGTVARSSLESVLYRLKFDRKGPESFKDYRKLVANVLVMAMKDAKALSDTERARCAPLIKKVEQGGVVEYEELASVMPVSDINFTSRVLPNIASYINKMSIRKSFPGTLALLKAGFRLVNIYDNGTWDDLGFTDAEKVEKALSIQRRYDGMEGFKDPAYCRMGFRYKITFPAGPKVADADRFAELRKGLHWFTKDGLESLYIELSDYNNYERLKAIVKLIRDSGSDYKISKYLIRPASSEAGEDVMYDAEGNGYVIEGRELAPMDIHFLVHEEGKDGLVPYNMYDVDSVRLLFKLKNPSSITDEDKMFIYGTMLEGLRKDGKYRLGLQSSMEAIVRAYYQHDMDELGRVYKGGKGSVYINGQLREVDPSGMKVYNYESVTPNINADVFGMDRFTQLKDVSQNMFAIKMLENWNLDVPSDLYSYAMLVDNGNHIYILDRNLSGDKEAELESRGYWKMEVGKDDGYARNGATYYLERGGRAVFKCTGNDTLYRNSRGDIIIATTPDTSKDEDLFTSMRFMDMIVSPSLFDGDEEADGSDVRNYLHMLIDANSFKYNEEGNLVSGGASMTYRGEKDGYEQIDEAINNAIDISRMRDKGDKDINEALNRKKAATIARINEEGTEWMKNEPSAFLQKVYERSLGKYNSFLMTLKTLSARIPSQTMQSFMGMGTVLFDNTGLNACYVNDMQLWLQGSDFDGDKVTFQEYAIDNRGQFIGWSPYFDNAQMEESLKLPFPTNRKASMARDGEKKLAMYDATALLFDAVFEYNKEKKKYVKKAKAGVRAVRLFLDATNRQMENTGGIAWRNTRYKEDAYADVKDFLDRHNMYFDKSDPRRNSGLKNFITYVETQIINNPVNLYEAQSSIDDFDMVKKEGAKDEAGKMRNLHNVADATTKYMAFVDNMVGKQVVSAVASSIKNFYGLTQYFNRIGDDISDNEIARLSDGENAADALEYLNRSMLGKDGKGITVSGRTYYTFANYNPNDKYRSVLNAHISRIAGLVGAELDSRGMTQEERNMAFYDILSGDYAKYKLLSLSNADKGILDINSRIMDASLQADNALILSALLTEATDNAKNLNLSKINATPELVSLYVYGLSIGMPLADIAKYVRSKTARIYNKMKLGNTFYNTGDPNLTFDKLNRFFVNLVHADMEGGTPISNNAGFSYLPGQIKKLFYDYDNSGYSSNNYRPANLKLYVFNRSGRKVEFNYEKIFNIFIKGGLSMDLYNNNTKIVQSEGDKVDEIAVLEALKADFQRQLHNFNNSARLIRQAKEWCRKAEQQIYARRDILSEYEKDALGNPVMEGSKLVYYINVLSKLENGAKEMRLSSKFMGTNKGAKGTLNEQQGWLKSVSNILDGSVKHHEGQDEEVVAFFDKYDTGNPYDDEIVGRDGKVAKRNGRGFNVHRFMTDGTYALEAKDVYAKTRMNTFNVLNVLDRLPHINSYVWVQDLVAGMMSNMSTIGKAATMVSSAVINNNRGLTQNEMKSVIGNTGRFIDALLFDLFLRNYEDGKPFSFWVQPGFEMYIHTTSGYKLKPVTEAREVSLDSNAGKMTFLKWMNEVVIPSYKNGLNDEVNPNNRAMFVNKFILDLVGDRVDKTLTGGITVTSKIPDDRMSNDSFDMRRIEEYKALAERLHDSKYVNKTDTGSKQFDMATLLFIMDQLVYNGSNSKNSLNFYLTPYNTPIKQEYYKFVDDFFCDANGNFDTKRVLGLLENDEYIIKSVAVLTAPQGNTYRSNATYLRSYNKREGKVETYTLNNQDEVRLFERRDDDEDADIDMEINEDMYYDAYEADGYDDDGISQGNNYKPTGYNNIRYHKIGSYDMYEIFPDLSISNEHYPSRNKAEAVEEKPVTAKVEKETKGLPAGLFTQESYKESVNLLANASESRLKDLYDTLSSMASSASGSVKGALSSMKDISGNNRLYIGKATMDDGREVVGVFENSNRKYGNFHILYEEGGRYMKRKVIVEGVDGVKGEVSQRQLSNAASMPKNFDTLVAEILNKDKC